MGSSAQNSSGVHWCRCRVRFNEVPEKVPKVPEKVWEALVQSQVRFNRVPEKVPEKVLGSLGAKPSQVQQDSGEGSGEAVGEALGLWCRAEVFPALGFAESFRKICKNQALRLLGIPPKLIVSFFLRFCCGDAFCTDRFLQTDDLTHRNLYTEQFLCVDTLTQTGSCTDKLLHADAFTHRGFYAKKNTHRGFYTPMLCTKMLLHA